MFGMDKSKTNIFNNKAKVKPQVGQGGESLNLMGSELWHTGVNTPEQLED
jgi:hypothetical protein